MRGIMKSFPGVRALRGVDLTLNRGEVLALLGENGAGKSTLMRVLGGAHAADAGTLHVDGCSTVFRTPEDSRRAGVAVIYQEFNLVPGLSAMENIFLGRETSRVGFVSGSEESRATRALFGRLGANFDPRTPCRTLTTAQQQLVEIAKALAFEARILVMDEPTAALTAHEVERLFGIIRELRRQGLGIIYISHRLDEIDLIADRITVLRDGRNVGEAPAGGISRTALIGLMVGRELKDEFPPRSSVPGNTRLEVHGLGRGQVVRDISFSVRRGEILAMTGLIGAGRTETARLIFGADPRDCGEIRLDGNILDIRSPRDAIRSGIGLLTEDRKLQGLVLRHSVLENFGLPNLERFSHRGFLKLGIEREDFADYARRLGIRIPGPEERAGNLSGGNQQKVVLAKWLARNCEVLIFDEPTRGIDVGAKYEIYRLMNELAAAGKALIMISSELPEVLGMADRILVLRQGRVAGEIADARQATQEEILHLAVE
ncbi:MAG: sugar ABC transporter ATP-binding protein [Verrucomicrobiales bacterium]|nr:sugar ABC transporter ATP-binding protein [Verrucomicrobiales bacterium]